MAALTEARVGIIYGTDTGNTEEVGEKIMNCLAAQGIHAEMIDISAASPDILENFDFSILGIPTWDFGGIQADWEDFEDSLAGLDLNGKVVALYGLGDQFGYSDFFVDAMGWLHEHLEKTSARIIGYWSTEGYDFEASRAANPERTQFCGLAVDEDQQIELTDDRVESWVKQIIREYEEALAA